MVIQKEHNLELIRPMPGSLGWTVEDRGGRKPSKRVWSLTLLLIEPKGA
jgi:hypothetical protein